MEGGDDVKPLMALMNWATHDATMVITKGSDSANISQSLNVILVPIVL